MVLTNTQFTEIYNDHMEKIYRFCYLKVSSKTEAQDLTSETFLKFIRYAQERDEEIENIRAFLYRTAQNLVIDHYRKREKRPLPLEEDWLEEKELPQVPSPEEKLLLNSDMKEVTNALGRIKDDQADLIIWHYLDGLSIPEISEINGKPEGTNRVALHRGLKALKESLAH